MGIEIERKFLVRNDLWRKTASSGSRLCQKYIPLADTVSGAVRVRIAGDAAFLTLKTAQKNLMRGEFEYKIPVPDAEKIMTELCPGGTVDKIRYRVPFEGFQWEVDEFLGVHAGLVVAELELDSPDREFPRPEWIGKEISDDFRYCNSFLAENPGVPKGK